MLIRKFKNRQGDINHISNEIEMQDMVGLVFTKVCHDKDRWGQERIVFECEHGQFVFQHEQDCCESVYVESIVGDLEDLVGNTLLVAEEVTSNYEEAYESGTWTFYKFATNEGYVDIRWLGESNGYYGEGVSLDFIALPGVNLEEVFQVKVIVIG